MSHPTFMPHYTIRPDIARFVYSCEVGKVGGGKPVRMSVDERFKAILLAFDIATINVMHRWEDWGRVQ